MITAIGCRRASTSMRYFIPRHLAVRIQGVDAWSQLQDGSLELAALNKECLIPPKAKKITTYFATGFS
jgi:hypothetical protein